MNLVRTLDAASEVLSLGEIKEHLRVTTTADDNFFRFANAAARRRAEQFLGKTLVTSTWQLKLDYFPPEICLPMPPVQSISLVEYVDTSGATQSFTNFQFDRGGRLAPAYGYEWPDTRDQFDAVTVTYIAGETNAGKVPEDIKHAIRLIVGAADVGREDIVIGAGVVISQIPDNAENLLHPYRLVYV